MRIIEQQSINLVNDGIQISVVDEPGHGGASHFYRIEGAGIVPVDLIFQKGPVTESGINGITQEALIAVVIDRLEGFERGPFASTDNSVALLHLHAAKDALRARTMGRISRGVEGRPVV